MIDDEHWENMPPPLDPTPRRLAPRSFVAHREREPGRLQLRLVLARDEHVDDIVVEEEEDCVIAFASVCGPTTGAHPEQMDGPVPRRPRATAGTAQGDRRAQRPGAALPQRACRTGGGVRPERERDVGDDIVD
jgi:hypothetical protein